MCFSAAVSYGVAGLLVPTGIYCLQRSREQVKHYWLVAALPLFFGLQQAVEGRIWQAMTGDTPIPIHPWALAFLFFSHFLWLFWVPLASYSVESEPRRRGIFLALAIVGVLAGTLLYLPLLLYPEWLSVSVVKHSIVYEVKMIHDLFLPAGLDRALYALVILLPLLYSSRRRLRNFGVLVALALLFSLNIYTYAFISVGCFFAAMLSFYLLQMFRRPLPE